VDAEYIIIHSHTEVERIAAYTVIPRTSCVMIIGIVFPFYMYTQTYIYRHMYS